jgi:cell division septum initiation protein DivIVA
MADSPRDIEELSLEDLQRFVLELLEEKAKLRSEIEGLREEVARLRGLKGRVKLKPSGMDKQAKARQKAKQGRKQAKRTRGAKRLAVDEERVIATPHPDCDTASGGLALSGL